MTDCLVVFQILDQMEEQEQFWSKRHLLPPHVTSGFSEGVKRMGVWRVDVYSLNNVWTQCRVYKNITINVR